jgi:hypothetical protein
MITITRNDYDLLLSTDPCEIFNYYGVTEMHGLNLDDCMKHPNTSESSYISGWCNYMPMPGKDFKLSDRCFVFINLNRCNSELDLSCNLFHELMHLSGRLFNDCWDSHEEEMISYAEKETREVFELTKYLI